MEILLLSHLPQLPRTTGIGLNGVDIQTSPGSICNIVPRIVAGLAIGFKVERIAEEEEDDDSETYILKFSNLEILIFLKLIISISIPG